MKNNRDNKNANNIQQPKNEFSPNRPGVQYRQVKPKDSQNSAQNTPQKSSDTSSRRTSTHNPQRTSAQSSQSTSRPVRPKSQATHTHPNTNNPDYARQRALAIQRKRAEQRRRNEALRRAFVSAISVTFFSLIATVICIAVIAAALNHDFNRSASQKHLPFEIIRGNDKENTLFLDEKDFSYKAGEYFVSLPAISEKLGFSLLGDVKKMTLSIDEKQNAVFNVGSNSVSVNGVHVSLTEHTYFSGGALYVPASFFTDFCYDTTFEATKTASGRVFLLSFPEKLQFMCCETSPTLPIPTDVLAAAAGIDIPEFTLDLSEYEKYMNPENRDEYLVLINTSNKLDSNYVADDLTDFIYTRPDRAYQKLRLYAAKSLEAMFMEMYAAGFNDVTVTSGYRSYDYQQLLFNNEVNSLRAAYGDSAEEKAAEAVAIPGSSEHQSGLCADLHNLSAASTAFQSQDAYKWLYANCADFGFILRYPKDKTDITGIMFEPWHYRFVGRYHAQKIMSAGLCLEEYVAQYNSQN